MSKKFVEITASEPEVWEELINEKMGSIRDDFFAYMFSQGVLIFGEDDLPHWNKFLDFVFYRYKDIDEAIRAMYYPLSYKDTIRDRIRSMIRMKVGV
jgi:hypothetical protein